MYELSPPVVIEGREEPVRYVVRSHYMSREWVVAARQSFGWDCNNEAVAWPEGYPEPTA